MVCIFEYQAFEITWKSIGIKKKELLGKLTWNSAAQLVLPGYRPKRRKARVQNG
jgi:hypothetical protein